MGTFGSFRNAVCRLVHTLQQIMYSGSGLGLLGHACLRLEAVCCVDMQDVVGDAPPADSGAVETAYRPKKQSVAIWLPAVAHLKLWIQHTMHRAQCSEQL